MSVQELQECLMVLGSSGIVVFAHQSLESLGRMVVSADILGGGIHTVAHCHKTDDGEIRRLTVVERIWIALAIVPLMMSLRHIAIWLQHWIGVEDASRKGRKRDGKVAEQRKVTTEHTSSIASLVYILPLQKIRFYKKLRY